MEVKEMTEERKELLIKKIKNDEITYDDFEKDEDFLFILDNGYKFNEGMIEDILCDFADVEGEIVEEKIVGERRWNTDKEIVVRFGKRFFSFCVAEGNTEMQETYYDPDIIEVFPKEITIKKTIYVQKENL